MNKKPFFVTLLMLFSVISLPCCSKKPSEPIYCQYADDITHPYIAYVSKKYQLYCYGQGGGFLQNVNKIILYFENQNKKLDVEQSRILIVNCVEELLQRINKYERIRPYLQNYPFTNKEIKISIAFYNKTEKRVEQKYIAFIFIKNGKLTYCSYNHETKQFIDMHEEPYTEALEKVKVSGQLQLSNS